MISTKELNEERRFLNEEALPALIPPQFHAYIVELALIVIRNISFHRFSCHILFLLFLSLKIELANDAKKTA